MLSSNNLLLPALIFTAAGFLVGILAMTIFSERGKNKDKDASITPEMDDLAAPATPVLPESRFESIAHIYREKASGKIVTDVNGKVHLTHNTIPPEQLTSLQESSSNWQYWLGMYEAAPDAAPVKPAKPAEQPPAEAPTASPVSAEAPTASPVSAEPPAPSPVSAEPPAPSPVSAEPPVPSPTSAEPPAASPTSAEPQTPVVSPPEEVSPPPAAAVEPPVQSPPAATAPTASAAPAKQPAPVEKPRARTMVGQIEDILQDMLPESEYAGQEIHLTEDPTNGVIVWVGAQKFTGINNVTDEGIKGLIQAAVRRWENSGGSM